MRMGLKDFIEDGEEFHYRVEQALRGRGGGDRRILYHYLMKNMGWSWNELMKTPYEVVYRTAIIMQIENAMIEYNINMKKGV